VRYGIKREQIDHALARNCHHIIICDDVATIRRVKADYGDVARAIFHQVRVPADGDLKQLLASSYATEEDGESRERLAKLNVLNRTFLENPTLFDAVLITDLPANPDKFQRSFERLLGEMVARDGRARIEVQQVAETLRIRPDTALRPSINPDPQYAFAIMAFSPEDPFLVDTYAAIRRACHAFNIRVDRVDEAEFTGDITEKVLASIDLAGVVVADLTHERPNVYYEVGFAHARGRPVILVARAGTAVHFDLRGKKIHFFKNATELETMLTATIGVLRVSSPPNSG
jgi:hypothetical protein